MWPFGRFLSMGVAIMCLGASATATIIPIESNYTKSLDGKWRFKLEQGNAEENPAEWRDIHPILVPTTFEAFYAPDYKEDGAWHDIDVPGNWEMAGFSPATYDRPDNSSGFYRKWIEIPKDWAGRLVRVNFDGVQNGAEIWLNGQPVHVTESSLGKSNYHESGWTAWQADLTPVVRFGERNLLALRVTKNTFTADLDSGDYFFLGGVYRPVTLFSVPQTHIEDLTIQTRLLPDNKAEVKIIVDVTGPHAASSEVTAQLEGFDPMVVAVGNGRAELNQIVDHPRLWSAEHPNLYSLSVTLGEDKPTEHIARKVGIREVTIKDGVLLVNGVKVKLAGICRHDVSPTEGTAVGHDLWVRDLTLMKAANINAVRTSHYPYGSGFYDLCDELGFYVIDEAPYCWCKTDTDEFTPGFEQRARETVARDKNHACVIIWGIGNENKPGKNLQVAADVVKAADPTRPRLVSWEAADLYGVELDDAHYTSPAAMQKAADDKDRRAKWPKIYTENPNIWDVRFGVDYGCLDLWTDVLRRTWAVALSSDGIPGLFTWEWQDRAVADKCPTKLYQYDPATGMNYLKVKGIVDGFRNPRPEYYNMKMVYSPIKIDPRIDIASQPGSALMEVSNLYSFTDLSELKANWRLTKNGEAVDSGTARLKLAPLTAGKVALRLPEGFATKADTLRIDFDHPRGWNVVSAQFAVSERKPASVMDNRLPDGLVFPRLNLVGKYSTQDRATVWRIYRYPAQLENLKIEPSGSGDLSKLALGDVRSIDADIVFTKSVTYPDEVPEPMDDRKVEAPDFGKSYGHLHAEFADGEFSYKIEWIGEKLDIEELGWIFDMPKAFDRFSWKREPPWSVYPEKHIGRPEGTALPDTADVHLTKITRPDAFDFNSTKYYCDWATLTEGRGKGLRVEFDPIDRHQVRGGFAQDGGYELIVNKQCSPPRDLSSNVVKDFFMTLSPGETIEGSFRVGSNMTE